MKNVPFPAARHIMGPGLAPRPGLAQRPCGRAVSAAPAGQVRMAG